MKKFLIAAVAAFALSATIAAPADAGRYGGGSSYGGGGFSRSYSSSSYGSSSFSRSYSSPSYSRGYSSPSYSSRPYSSPSYATRPSYTPRPYTSPGYRSNYVARPLNTAPAYRGGYARPAYGYHSTVIVHPGYGYHYGYGGMGGFWNGYMMGTMFHRPMYVMPGGGYSPVMGPGYVPMGYNPVASVVGWLLFFGVLFLIAWAAWALFFRRRFDY